MDSKSKLNKNLFLAKRAVLLGKKWEALEYYEQALKDLKGNNNLEEEALVNELTGKFCWENQLTHIGTPYLQKAYDCYVMIQNLTKVRELKNSYPQLFNISPDNIFNYNQIKRKNREISLNYSEKTLRESQVRLKLVNNILQGITVGLPLDEIISLIISDLSEYFNGFRVSYLKIDSQNNAKFTHSLQPPEMTSLTNFEFKLTEFPAYFQSLQKNKYLAIEDLTQAEIALGYLMLTNNTLSCLDFPIKYSGKLIGILCFDYSVVHQWTEHEIATLREIADYLVFAHQNAQIKQEQQLIERCLEEANLELEKTNQQLQYLNMAMGKAMPGFSRLDHHGDYLEVNQFYAETLGTTPELLIGKSWRTTVFIEDLPKAITAYRKMQNEGKADLEIRGIRQDGSIIYKQVFLVKADLKTSGFNGHFCFCKDVTELHLTLLECQLKEQELCESEAKFRQLAENIDQVFFIQQYQPLKLLYVNPIVEKIWGLPQDVFYQNPFAWLDSIHPEDYQKVREGFEKSRQGIGFNQQYRIIKPNGEIRWVWVRTFLVTNEQGEIDRIVGIGEDITEKKQAEEARQKSEQLYRCIVETSEEGIWIIDINNKTTFVNPKMAKMLGYTVSEMMEKSMFDFMDEEGVKIATNNVERRRQGIKELHDFKFHHKNGSNVWTIISTSPMYDENGQYQGALGMIADISERKQIEIKLKHSEQRYISLAKVVPVGIIRYDQQGRCIYVNQKYEQIVGVSQEKLWGETWFNYIHPEDQNQVLEKWSNFLYHQIPFELEYRLVSCEGKITWVYSQIVTELDQDENIIGYVASLTDFSEKQAIIQDLKSTQEALQESEKIFRQLTNNIQQVFYITDLSVTKQIYLSPGYEKIWGKPLETIYQNPNAWMDSIHPEDKEQIIANLQTPEQRSNYDGEYRIIRSDGEIRWIRARNFPVYDESGKIYRVAGIAEDITTKKQIEQKLTETHKEMEAIFAAFPDLFLKVDDSGTILDYKHSPNFCELYTTPDRFLNQPLEQVLPLEVVTKAKAVIKKSLRTKTVGKMEYSLLIANTIQYYETRFVAISDNELITIIRNISDLILIQKQLIKAKNEAETANKAKSEFLANMSHELRTPLNGILGFTQILQQDSQLNPQQLHQLEIINTCSHHLLTLINDILDLAKIEAGKIELEPHDFDLPQFLLEIAEIAQISAQQKGIFFSYQPLTELPSIIYADEKRLRQVLLNIIHNGIKFTPKGSVTFKVELREKNELTKQCKIRFKIRDTGIGIPPDKILDIFKPFEQLKTHNYQEEGTGLGLTISKEIITKMGGLLQVKSKLNQGSIFWIELNLAYKSNSLSSYNSDQTRKIVGYEGNEKTILIVDDSKINRNLLNYILTKIGFKVAEACHGKEGLRKALKFKPDLMIIDLLMPEMDGFTLVKKIRNLPYFQDTILIAHSASVSELYIQKSFEVGFNDFIPKPVKTKKLLEQIQDYLGLTWKYKEKELQSSEEISSNQSTTEVTKIPQTELLKLSDLAKKGLIDDLIQEVNNLKSLYPDLEEFANEITNLAREFKLKQIREILQKAMGREGSGE
jgi:PAS domain S-box-containing protein